jgi:hypothetical protein
LILALKTILGGETVPKDTQDDRMSRASLRDFFQSEVVFPDEAPLGRFDHLLGMQIPPHKNVTARFSELPNELSL